MICARFISFGGWPGVQLPTFSADIPAVDYSSWGASVWVVVLKKMVVWHKDSDEGWKHIGEVVNTPQAGGAPQAVHVLLDCGMSFTFTNPADSRVNAVS